MTERVEEELLALYIALYCDEDIPIGIVNNMRTRGFDVTCARDEGTRRWPDNAQMQRAISQRRAMLTHNRAHFEQEHRKLLEAAIKHYGIIIAKRRNKDGEVVARLIELLNTLSAEEIEDQLRYI